MLKWEYVNRTCVGCGKVLCLVARLRGGNYLLQCQEGVTKIKGLVKAKKCRHATRQFMVSGVGLEARESPELGLHDRAMDNDSLVGD